MKHFLLVFAFYLHGLVMPAFSQHLLKTFPSETEAHTNDTNLTNLTLDGRRIEPSDFETPVAVHNTKANEYLIVWHETKMTPTNDFKVILARRINGITGAPLGDIITVSDPPGYDKIEDAESPAVHYDSLKNRYFIVWLAKYENDSKNHIRNTIRGQYLDADTLGKLQPYSFTLGGENPNGIFSKGYIMPPDLTFNTLSGEYLVVWVGQAYIGNPAIVRKEVFGQRVLDYTQPGSDDFRITTFGDQFKTFVHAAKAEFSPVSNNYLVVFQGETYYDSADPITGHRHGHILYSQILSNTGVISAGTKIVSPVAEFMSDLQMTYNPARNEHFIIWKTHGGTSSGTGNVIFGQILKTDGSLSGNIIWPLNDSNNNSAAYSPAVEYWADRGQYIVLWGGYEGHRYTTYLYGQLIDAEKGTRTGVDSFRISERMIDLNGGRRPALAVNNIPGAAQMFTAWAELRYVYTTSRDDLFGIIFRPYATNVTLTHYDLDDVPFFNPNATPTPAAPDPEIDFDLVAKIEKMPAKSFDEYKVSCLNQGKSKAEIYSLKIYQSQNKKFEVSKDVLIKEKTLSLKKKSFKIKLSSKSKIPYLIAKCDAAKSYIENNEANNIASMRLSKKQYDSNDGYK